MRDVRPLHVAYALKIQAACFMKCREVQKIG